VGWNDARESRRPGERIDGGKLRATCGTWDDAVVVLPDRVLTLSNHERQVHIVRGHKAAERPPTPPDLVRIISRPPPGEGARGESRRLCRATCDLGRCGSGPPKGRANFASPL
jgi:hypothetical protein